MPESLLPADFLQGVPSIAAEAFVAAGACLMGDVRLASGASIWYNCVLRGDLSPILIGENSNIQDGSILHVETGGACVVEDHVTVGHGAILHACTVGSGCLIGMGAILLSRAQVGRGSLIAAGALVPEDARIEPFSLMAGVPAKFVRRLPEQILARHFEVALKYAEAARRHRELASGSAGSGRPFQNHTP
jgi:carbonic anhydrase/acetyltransferase-like protein (isoleucine patch superfamily)